jgi:EAL domain-containing protein (putative c-di-GMP-specific phosphodiesterase class I)
MPVYRYDVRRDDEVVATGHLSHKRSIQVGETLEIDRSFVRQLDESEHSRKLVASVVQLAHTLGLAPLAEGVETEDQRRFLVERGCRYGQGFLFSRPLRTDQFKAFYDREQRTKRRIA